MTLAQRVLRLVSPDLRERDQDRPDPQVRRPPEPAAARGSRRATVAELELEPGPAPVAPEPLPAIWQDREVTLVELRAAAMLVASGGAGRVVLTGFQSFRGLLTEVEALSREFDVLIVPTVGLVRGQVDLVVTTDPGTDG